MSCAYMVKGCISHHFYYTSIIGCQLFVKIQLIYIRLSRWTTMPRLIRHNIKYSFPVCSLSKNKVSIGS